MPTKGKCAMGHLLKARLERAFVRQLEQAVHRVSEDWRTSFEAKTGLRILKSHFRFLKCVTFHAP